MNACKTVNPDYFCLGVRSCLRACLMLTGCLWLLLSSTLAVADPIMVNKQLSGLPLVQHAEFLRDSGRHSQPQQLDPAAWKPLRQQDSYQAVTGDSFWVRLSLHNPDSQAHRWVIAHDYVWIDYMTAFVFEGNQVRQHQVGDREPFYRREIYAPQPAVGDLIAAGATQQVYIRLNNLSPDAVSLTFKVYEQSNFATATQAYVGLHSLYAGVFIGLCILWLVLGVTLKRMSLISYALFLFSSMTIWASSRGLIFQYVLPEYPSWNNEMGLARCGCMAFFSFLFMRQILNLGTGPRWANRLSWALLLFSLLVVFGSATGVLGFGIMVLLARLDLLLMSVNALFALNSWRRGVPHVGWLAIGWVIYGMVMITSIWVSTIGGALPIADNLITINQCAALLEVLCFTFSLAQWLHLQQMQRITAELSANVDGLTGLNNRRHLWMLLNQLMQRPPSANQRWLAVIDLDHFKQINDLYGHAAGDAVLRNFARVLKTHSRSKDIYGRYGGEEFVIVYDYVSRDAVLQVADRLRASFAGQPTVFQDQVIRHTFSMGLAEARAGEDLDSWFQRADAALYQAKNQGRNQVVADDKRAIPETRLAAQVA